MSISLNKKTVTLHVDEDLHAKYKESCVRLKRPMQKDVLRVALSAMRNTIREAKRKSK